MTVIGTHERTERDGRRVRDSEIRCDGPACENHVTVPQAGPAAVVEDRFVDWTFVLAPGEDPDVHFCTLRCHVAWAIDRSRDLSPGEQVEMVARSYVRALQGPAG